MAQRSANLITLLSLACGPKGKAPADHPPNSQPSAASQPQKATDTVIVSGPTVIAAFPVTQAEADSGQEVNEALGDFQFHLASARDSLRALGIAVIERYDSLVPIREDWGTWIWRVGADSGGVGYLLVVPRRPSKTFWGVMTNSDLVDAAAHYFEKR